MKGSFLMGVLLLAQVAVAQKVIDISKTEGSAHVLLMSVGGEPVLSAKVVNTVSGSPYFRNEWMNTSLLLPSGEQYTNVHTRLDLMRNQLYYLDGKKNEFVAQSLIREVAFKEENGPYYRFVHSRYIEAPELKEGWYQLLAEGPATLYKYYSKTLLSQKPYGSATEEQVIQTKEKYLVVYQGQVYELKKLKDAPDVLPGKKEALKTFVSGKELESLSTEGKYVALVRYYNSLLP
jgi:hypothetical protein